MGGGRRRTFWRNDTRYAYAFKPFDNLVRLDFVVEVSDTRTTTHHGDKDDVENGSVRVGSNALVPGSGVSSFDTSTFMGWLISLLALGRHNLFDWKPISNDLPFLSDYHRRSAAGLAGRRLTWVGTRQIRNVSRGQFTRNRCGGRYLLENC
jgi:hypothetical protein